MPERYALTFGEPGLGGEVVLCLDRDAGRASYDAILELGPEHGVIAVRDADVPPPRSSLLEVRADGLWAEVVHEADEHWSFGLEAFGLRFDSVAEARVADVGDRVPVGYDLEWDRGRVVGELLVVRARIPVDTTGTFEATTS
ncbi:MAG TPA: hypothetical protein VFZ17_03665 [Acidimicrobiia bacterium]|nr:hypothetical protein [Acidimicrobiia bacterium]